MLTPSATHPKQKHSYLLRVWRVDEATWRIYLHSVDNGSGVGFTTFSQLVSFLEEDAGIYAPSQSMAQVETITP
jgi:hypothetical protein